MKLLQLAEAGYRGLIKAASYLQSPFLLVVRLYWGWQFFVAGRPKLEDVPKFANLFAEWGIPFPTLNVYLAGGTECIAGLLLLLGLGSRIAAIPLCFTMIVAYVTTEMDVVKGIFGDPDAFVSAAPFQFMFAALLILIFGPGVFSADYAIKRWILKRDDSAKI